MEGYHQITINEWLEQKEQLRRELNNVREGFVRVGYVLRKMEETRAYEAEGYKSVAEFAEKEHGLKPSTTSRWMSINREFSVGGYSMQLDPKYINMNASQLTEMLTLSVEDREMVRPETQREDIRELKRLGKEEPAAENGLEQIIKLFLEENPEMHREMADWMKFQQDDPEELLEIVNPSGNRSFRKNGMMLMMYEDGIKYKAAGKKPETVKWSEFFEIAGKIEPKKDEEKGTDGEAAVESPAESAGEESPEGSRGEVAEGRGVDDERRAEVDGGSDNGEVGAGGSLSECGTDGDGDPEEHGGRDIEGSGLHDGTGESGNSSGEGGGYLGEDNGGIGGSGGPHGEGRETEGKYGTPESGEAEPAAALGVHETADLPDEETEPAALPPVAENPSDKVEETESSGSITDDFPAPEGVENVDKAAVGEIAPAQFANEIIVDEDGSPADEEDGDGAEELTLVGKIHNTIQEVRYCMREISSKVDYRKWDEAYAAAVELTGYLDFLVGNDVE